MKAKTQNTETTKANIFNIIYLLSLPLAILFYFINL